MGLDPTELTKIARKLQDIQTDHAKVLEKEPQLKKSVSDGVAIAKRRFEEVSEKKAKDETLTKKTS